MLDQASGPHISLFPTSRTGWVSVVSGGLSVIGLAIFFAMVEAGQRGGETFGDNLLLTVPILVTAVGGVTALVTGVLALLRDHERGLLIVIPILWGLLVTVFIAGELLYPH